MENTYVLVMWPESQLLMDEEWFDECILMNDENHLENIGSSAYFVPIERILIEPIGSKVNMTHRNKSNL